MVLIAERRAEDEDRAGPEHWEGDLIMGAANCSAVGTRVERTSRYVLLLHLGADKSAMAVGQAMRNAILTLPAELRRSVTRHQGKEMGRHAAFTVATGIPVRACDPHSPWQRGSNENLNGLLRQYLPKDSDLSLTSPAELLAIQHSLSNRPRATLGFTKPSEELAEILALTG